MTPDAKAVIALMVDAMSDETPRTDAAMREIWPSSLAEADALLKLARALERETVELANTVLALEARERGMREALDSVAWNPGGWEAIAPIEYCRFCSYSRPWIAEHGHGNTCPLYEDRAALAEGEKS